METGYPIQWCAAPKELHTLWFDFMHVMHFTQNTELWDLLPAMFSIHLSALNEGICQC